MINVKYNSASDLIEWSNKLEGKAYKKIEYFMNDFYGLGWSFSDKAKEICEYLKESMYFDEKLGYWVDK